MSRRRMVVLVALGWAAVGLAIAMMGLRSVNGDAVVLVVVASVLGPAAAVAGAWCVGAGRDRWAGALLLLSVVTPTYFAFAVNVIPLGLGVALVAAPGALLGRRAGSVPEAVCRN